VPVRVVSSGHGSARTHRSRGCGGNYQCFLDVGVPHPHGQQTHADQQATVQPGCGHLDPT
jgi:hypothetical protein